ncbi:N-acetylglucosaminyldiphosphoundecaprenol N-acetyl-beta-D-mannosaminyltransferase [Limnospira platensis C1]|nr:N-acetylglucosaminyldiphosphoundecaprenol N-acetyl-beta-D-mannosaminyltransferase [Arthrospira platensis C1]
MRELTQSMAPSSLTPETHLPTFPVLGLPVHLADNYSQWLSSRLSQGLGTNVITLNAEMAIAAESNQPLAELIRNADLVIPDGAGVVLYLKFKGHPIQRCPGIELAETLLHEFNQLIPSGLVFFYGGKPGIAQKAAEHFQHRIKGLAIASYHGYLSDSEEQEMLASLQELQPQLILVGLGVPRQEFWIAKNRHLCPDAVWIGVGGSFDIWGEKNNAPPLGFVNII